MKRARTIALITTAAIALAAAALIIWNPWSETAYAASDLPSACTELAAVPEPHGPAFKLLREHTYPNAGAGRTSNESDPGTTLHCIWEDDKISTIWLDVELWTAGAEAASASLPATRAKLEETGMAIGDLDLGDEALIGGKATVGGGAVRTGNVVIYATTILKDGNATEHTITALKTALTTIGAS
ncbi:hypothetical protein AB0I28_14360 [Phytomonospora sp. NPDC050363]|uniref:hypothetical protein n=1 Tax=Phytomonospora sp. NPDC050363 TaxID=3155642 RepID=UPI0033CE01C9